MRGVERRLTVEDLRELYEKNGQTLISFVGGKYESIRKTQSIQRCHNCCVEWQSLVTHVLHGGASCACMYRENYFLSWTTVEKRPGDPIHVYYAEFTHTITGETFYKIGLSKFKNRFGQHVGDYKVSVKIIDTTTVYIGYLREQQTITDYMEYKTEPAILRNGKKGTGECFSVDVLGLFNTK
ncbi:hypothetical protein [uncultured Photobacterium sp.]|uniref:hypothetical protein n=1 Tax=uncultured Photobacterium sp. TaxID=173973 RepID=UPI002626805D|nr:hypothetical protein [uncultured Photobacterium sp.]